MSAAFLICEKCGRASAPGLTNLNDKITTNCERILVAAARLLTPRATNFR
jgi:hypothetical protein